MDGAGPESRAILEARRRAESRAPMLRPRPGLHEPGAGKGNSEAFTEDRAKSRSRSRRNPRPWDTARGVPASETQPSTAGAPTRGTWGTRRSEAPAATTNRDWAGPWRKRTALQSGAVMGIIPGQIGPDVGAVLPQDAQHRLSEGTHSQDQHPVWQGDPCQNRRPEIVVTKG